MSVDYDGSDNAIHYCRECDDPTEGDPFLCWGCDPQKIAERNGFAVEWGYSEDGRGRPRGSKSTADDPNAEQWARENAAKWRNQGGQVFARPVGDWVVLREE